MNSKAEITLYLELNRAECVAGLEMMNGPHPISTTWARDGLSKRPRNVACVIEVCNRDLSRLQEISPEVPLFIHPIFIRGDHAFNLPLGGVAFTAGIDKFFSDAANAVAFDYTKRRTQYINEYLNTYLSKGQDARFKTLDRALRSWDNEQIRHHQKDVEFVNSQTLNLVRIGDGHTAKLLIIKWTGEI